MQFVAVQELPMRMKKKPNLALRLERRADLLVAEPKLLRGLWLDNFCGDELRAEIGCGKGRFTVETAKAEPDVLFVALEKTSNVLITALERVASEGLQNVRFINAFADDLPDYFAPGEVSRIYLNFCDPWPSNRHLKRRLTYRSILDLYRQVLSPGGELYFKTDNLQLFEFSLREFEYSGFAAIETVRDLHKNGPVGIMSDYELKFHEQGEPIFMCRTQRPAK